jgi:hypothetical protein
MPKHLTSLSTRALVLSNDAVEVEVVDPAYVETMQGIGIRETLIPYDDSGDAGACSLAATVALQEVWDRVSPLVCRWCMATGRATA